MKTFILALFIISVSAQQQNKHWIDFLKPESVKCYNEVRQIQAECFKNVNLNLTVMDNFFIGRLHPSQVNTSPQDFVNDVCSKRSRVVECVIPAVINKRGKDACTEGSYFNMAVQELTQRLSMYNQACNISTYFAQPKEPCMQTIFSKMFNCHIKAGTHENFFTTNATLSGALIGGDKKSAEKFCSKRFTLFNCIKAELQKCPAARDYYLLNGYDYDSMEESVHLLCSDTDLYLQGLECFQSPRPAVINCVNQMTAEVLDLSVQQYLDGATRETYLTEYCKIRARHVECDIKAWEQKCEPFKTGLKNQFQCKMLPRRCESDTDISKGVCHTNNFNLHLRSSGRAPMTSLPIVLFALVTVFVKFYH